MYVKTSEGVAISYPYTTANLRSDNSQTSFPSVISDEMLANYGVYPVTIQDTPTYDPTSQYVETANLPTLIDDVWVQTKAVVDMTPTQLEARDDRLKIENKNKATQLLQQTDWTVMPDVADPLQSNPYLTNQVEFVAYRNQLRGIAVNPTVTAVFPTIPNEVWS